MNKQYKYYVVKVGQLYVLRLTEFRDKYRTNEIGAYTGSLEDMKMAETVLQGGIDFSAVEEVAHAT
jgi:hypothetical protein